MAGMKRLKYLFYKFLLGNSVTLLLSLIEGFMGLKEGQLVWQLFSLYEVFLIEYGYKAGSILMNVYSGLDKMGEALILLTLSK